MGIRDYRVVQSSGEDRYAENAVKEVVKGVQDYLDRGGGWKPTGGICVISENGFYTAFPALCNG